MPDRHAGTHGAAVWHDGERGPPSPGPFGRLHRWLAPSHLDPDAVEVARDAFSGGNHIVVDDFLEPAIASRVGSFLAHGARYRRLHGLFPDRTVSEDQWWAATLGQRAFRLGALDDALADAPPVTFQLDALWFAELRSVLAGDAFARYLALVTGRGPFAHIEVGAHALQPGDFVAPHDDARHGRELAFVLFLTPRWGEGYGGALRIIPPGGGPVVVDARYNRFAAFETGLPHAVDEVRGGAQASVRRSVVAWCASP